MSEERIPLEKTIVARIVGKLKLAGYPFVYKTHGSAYQMSGIPDITTIARNGRFVGLEVKRPKLGRLTPIQAATLDRITEAGGYAAGVTSVEEAMEAMGEVTGSTVREDITARIFERFCVGK